MKNYFLLFFSFVAFFAHAQQKSGIIHFKENIKLNIDFGDNPEMAKMMPTSQSVDKALFFNQNESLYKNEAPPKDLELNQEKDGNTTQIVMKMPESEIYNNLKEDLSLQTQDLMDKDFLIKDKIKKTSWKITGEQIKILDYVCQKAVPSDTSKHLVAWFTPQLPISFGPDNLSGLPGIILGLDYDNGQRTVFATKMEPLPNNYKFEIPTKGKKVNRAEFEKIRDEKMKEMGMETNGGTSVKMIIQTEEH